MDKKLLITNIQRFCVHDGPGIRTTIFLKGCNIHCPWCANPENMRSDIEYYCLFSPKKEGIYGQYVSFQKIFDEVAKDKAYYQNGGGVTFSGGDPLLFFPQMTSLLNQIYQEKISICAETSLFVPQKNVRVALEYLDTIIIDIKILEKNKCAEIIGGDLNVFLENVNVVNKSEINVIYRVPLIVPYTTTDDNLARIIDFLKDKHYVSVELIKGHNLAEKKYISLNRKRYVVPDLSDAELLNIKKKFKANGIDTVICKI